MRGRIFAAVLIATLWGSSTGASVRPVYGGGARLGAEGALETGDPALAATFASRLLARATHCTLADLTSSIERLEDGLVRVRIFSNLVFHDGTRLRAGDVAASLSRVARMEPLPPSAWRLLVIAKGENAASAAGELAITVTGDTTLELRMVAAGLDLLDWLDDPALAIVREDGRSACGPFKLPAPEQSSPDGEIRLVSFDRHPRGRPFLETLTLFSLPPPSTQRMELTEADGALGPWPLPDADLVTPDRRLLSLRLAPRLGSSSPLRLRLSEAMDREPMARFLLGSDARPIESLAALVEGEAAATGTRDRTDSSPSASLPSTITVGYDSSSPMQRRLAERIQLRLHDQGVRAVLLPIDDPRGSSPSAADLIIDLQDQLPSCPIMRLVSIAHRHGGTEIAQWALTALLSGPEPVDHASLAAALQEAVGLVPLASMPSRVWLRENLQLAPGAGQELDPAELWRWPEDLPRGDASIGATGR